MKGIISHSANYINGLENRFVLNDSQKRKYSAWGRAYTCNSQSGQFKASLGCIGRSCLKKKGKYL
jgi:hypothetical protein